jgi:hypothetical protein
MHTSDCETIYFDNNAHENKPTLATHYTKNLPLCVEEESDNDDERSSPCLSFRLPLLLENLELVFAARFMMMV